MVHRSTDRRGVSRHAKPLFPAAAPMELVIAGSAIEQRLHGCFAIGAAALPSTNIASQHQSSGSGKRTAAS